MKLARAELCEKWHWPYRVCSSDKMAPIYFLRLSKVWSMLHHRSVGGVQSKECYYTIFVVFRHKIYVFIIFISFFDKVSNFRNRILTNQKRELVVSNCQWNCMCNSIRISGFRLRLVRFTPAQISLIVQTTATWLNFFCLSFSLLLNLNSIISRKQNLGV